MEVLLLCISSLPQYENIQVRSIANSIQKAAQVSFQPRDMVCKSQGNEKQRKGM